MEILGMDHVVLTTGDLAACLDFYGRVLGLTVRQENGQYSLHFGRQKINLHTRPAEFLPAAAHPTAGSLDFCFAVGGSLKEARSALLARGAVIDGDEIARHGAQGAMKSLYLRDPEGNLVELGFYDP